MSPKSTLPATGAKMRAALGTGFAADFTGALSRLGVDVVVVPDLSTAYSFVLSGQAVIAIPAIPNWYRSNWSLAHELAHLALGHGGVLPGNSAAGRLERAANAFAAELVLPEDEIRGLDGGQLTVNDLAQLVWDAYSDAGGYPPRALPSRDSYVASREQKY